MQGGRVLGPVLPWGNQRTIPDPGMVKAENAQSLHPASRCLRANERCPPPSGALQPRSVFSWAVVMWEMLTFDVPWGTGNPWTVSAGWGERVRQEEARLCASCCVVGDWPLAGCVVSLQPRPALPLPLLRLLQLVSHVLAGGRLEVPPVEALPGGDAPALRAGLGIYVALMRRCWADAPEERPSFNEIVPELRCGRGGLLQAVVGMGVKAPAKHVCCSGA